MLSADTKKSEESSLVPLIVIVLVILTFLLVPLKITGYGFLPMDDALRHAGKAVSGKSWSEILVHREGITIYAQPGWQAILDTIHGITGWGTDALVVFSVISLFIILSVLPVFYIRRPEAWLLAFLTVVLVNPTYIIRFLNGRPFLFTMAALVALGFFWPRLRDKKADKGVLLFLTALLALSVWIHGAWYLFVLPILSFFLAREWRAAARVSVVTVIGVLLGSFLTGNPVSFFKESVNLVTLGFGSHQSQRLLATELWPYHGDIIMLIAVFGILAWRRMRGSWDSRRVDNPIFILAAICWVLGLVVRRFWLDWGVPAACVWIAQEFEDAFDIKIALLSWRRVLIALAACGTFYIASTTDVDSRWSRNLVVEYLSMDEPEHAQWLPEPGGIIYSDDMNVFYLTFFKNPKAPWRYALAFEPTIMTKENLAIYRKIQWNFWAPKSYAPWVVKMRPEDRLILIRSGASPPDIPGLEWHYTATRTWIGRLPRAK